MIVLCDTCSVLMLIRIAPEMFRDPKYECVTIRDVYNEMFRTSRFKGRYPWRDEYKPNITCLGVNTHEETSDFKEKHEIIKHLVREGVVSNRNGKRLDLSPEDQKIATYSMVEGFEVTTTDIPLIDFLYQELEKKVYSPLSVINYWLKKGVMTWSKSLEDFLTAWKSEREPPQPPDDIKEYEELTSKKYPGP